MYYLMILEAEAQSPEFLQLVSPGSSDGECFLYVFSLTLSGCLAFLTWSSSFYLRLSMMLYLCVSVCSHGLLIRIPVVGFGPS